MNRQLFHLGRYGRSAIIADACPAQCQGVGIRSITHRVVTQHITGVIAGNTNAAHPQIVFLGHLIQRVADGAGNQVMSILIGVEIQTDGEFLYVHRRVAWIFILRHRRLKGCVYIHHGEALSLGGLGDGGVQHLHSVVKGVGNRLRLGKRCSVFFRQIAVGVVLGGYQERHIRIAIFDGRYDLAQIGFKGVQRAFRLR